MSTTKQLKKIRSIRTSNVPTEPYSLLYELKFSTYLENPYVVMIESIVAIVLPAEKNLHSDPLLEPK